MLERVEDFWHFRESEWRVTVKWNDGASSLLLFPSHLFTPTPSSIFLHVSLALPSSSTSSWVNPPLTLSDHQRFPGQLSQICFFFLAKFKPDFRQQIIHVLVCRLSSLNLTIFLILDNCGWQIRADNSCWSSYHKVYFILVTFSTNVDLVKSFPWWLLRSHKIELILL